MFFIMLLIWLHVYIASYYHSVFQLTLCMIVISYYMLYNIVFTVCCFMKLCSLLVTDWQSCA